MDLSHVERKCRSDDLKSRLLSLQASLPEPCRLIHELRKAAVRRQDTRELREEWFQRHRPRFHSAAAAGQADQIPISDKVLSISPQLDNAEFHLATLPATFSCGNGLNIDSGRLSSRKVSATHGALPPYSERRRLQLKRIEAGMATPKFKTALSQRLAGGEQSDSSAFDALNRPFVPLPHLYDKRPDTALYDHRENMEIWRGEVEKRVPERLPLAVPSALTPPKHIDLSEGEFRSTNKPVFYHARGPALPRQYIINHEWFSEKAALKNLKGHRSNRLAFGWTK